jgi:hypothetical protein
MSQKYPGGFITKSPVAPTALVASGMWTIDQAMQLKKQGLWPSFTVPGAPTIGTATQTGPTTATVVYTAPASDGGTAITSYTATSSPAGGTGTLSQAGSGTITVTGLTTNTSYTFTVTATNAVGTGPASAASNSVTPVLPAIGAAFGGGFFAGQISTAGNSIADYNLVVGPAATAQQSTGAFKNANTNDAGATSVIDGPANSASMNDASHNAAQFCEGLTVGGFTDWYLPAKNELEICYFNLKPTTQSNDTGSGINANAVPARASNYTAGNPAQTTSAAFKDTGAEDFTTSGYWSSTQASATNGFSLEWADGRSANYAKTTNQWARAVRRVAV